MSIAFKEGLKIPPPALNEVILASNQDIRQVLINKLVVFVTDSVSLAVLQNYCFYSLGTA